MVRQAHHERLNLMAVTQSVGTIIVGGLNSYRLSHTIIGDLQHIFNLYLIRIAIS
ncbi:protein of unknown function [Methylotuvimicrobium alcaliphilum 20Z]|uniref:Uncharacterized protein n=1 Tax=Methylotuvimicrobium alcaliphilum (strain DSM 19304 / NCIMB 14124 / VKM B-2133 / 20Z) TaxID=1091494 RepID=G4SXR7_META2|nr:protein of unknown function [Methylotuvimicrobium alcaliphilum 20Z]